jgi:hypothetical protein
LTTLSHGTGEPLLLEAREKPVLQTNI